jgi:hypothetical protein
MISYIQVLDVFKTFAQGHLQIQKFDFEFREQMPNLATVDEAYPMLFVVPVGGSTLENVREFDIDVYCVDRYQKDRSNVNYVISDTDLILGDLTRWLEEGQNDIEVVRTYTTTPINNDLLDYVGGHVMRMRVQVDRIALCEIPFDGEQPTPPTCPSAIVRNSDGSWSDIVASGGTYIVPDTPVTVTDQDGNPLGGDSVPSVTGGNIEVTIAPSGDGEAVLLDTDGNVLSTTPVPPETTVNIVAPDAIAELYFDGELIDTLSILSGGTDSFNIDCFTLLNAVRVESDEFSHQHTGTFIYIGEENSKPKYEKDGDPDRVIRYNGTRWILEKLGGGAHTHDAAIGNEDFPWLANWTDAFLLVSQATIGTYCANGAYSYYELVDTDGNVLQTGSIPSGGTSTIVAPDSSYLVEYENGTPIQSGTILSGGSETIQVPNPIICEDANVENSDGSYTATVASGGTLILPDETINLVDEFGNPINTFTFPVYTDPNIDITSYCPAASDATAVLKDTLGNTLSTTNIPSGTSDDIIAPDADVENSDASYTDTIESGGTLVLPDSDVNVNGNLEGTVVSVQPIDIDVTDGTNPVTPDAITISGNTVTIEVPAGGGAPVGATLMKTGQTTSYRTGDDGDLEAGRATDFFTLASNNPFGNTNRFTDELGGQTYTNNIVIDWSTYDGSTVLGWRRTTNGVDINWNNAIDGALLVSIGTFTSGWRLPNIYELFSLMIMDSLRGLNYAPFNNNNNDTFWSSTTAHPTTSNKYSIANATKNIISSSNTSTTNFRYIPCRTFTVTGTTLS